MCGLRSHQLKLVAKTGRLKPTLQAAAQDNTHVKLGRRQLVGMDKMSLSQVWPAAADPHGQHGDLSGLADGS